MIITSCVNKGPTLPSFDTDTVKNEPMLFSCDLDHAWFLGGPITKAFLEALNFRNLPLGNCIVDTRVHMLMKDWYPCIPGFHHDDVDRNRPDGQPNYISPRFRSEMAFAIVGDDICRTEFALGNADFRIPQEGETVYGVWHKKVLQKLESAELKSYSPPPGQIIYFNDRTWHQGTASIGRGWRWFGRLTLSGEGDQRKPFNEVRRQVQVYMESVTGGW